MATNICRKTHGDLFVEVTPKKVFVISVGENLQAKVAQKKVFGQVWGNSGKYTSHPKNIFLLLYHGRRKVGRSPWTPGF